METYVNGLPTSALNGIDSEICTWKHWENNKKQRRIKKKTLPKGHANM